MIARNLAPLAIFAALVVMSCSSNKESGAGGNVSSRQFGKTPAGETVELYTLKNAKGAEVRISTYGGVIVSLKVPDRSGAPGDIVLGFDDFDGYLKPPPYFGAIIGRYGNRIAHGKFTLDGVDYTLAKNDGENSLHGGSADFNSRCYGEATAVEPRRRRAADRC